MVGCMWVLDPGNSRELLERLRPHALTEDFEVVWCGEGWRDIVSRCHSELVAVFPDYRFYAIKQKWGELAYQARPGSGEFLADQIRLVDEITERYAAESLVTCEWCARPGTLRERDPQWLTLCDRCHQDLAGTHYPSSPAPPHDGADIDGETK